MSGKSLLYKLFQKRNHPSETRMKGTSDKSLKVKPLLLSLKTQEKSDLFFSNKIATFASVEVVLKY